MPTTPPIARADRPASAPADPAKHLAWADTVAAAVAAHFAFTPDSPEGLELRLAARRELDRVAPKFAKVHVRGVPFRGWAYVFVERSCLGTGRALFHRKWARAVARGVREHYRFGAGSQEEQDIEGVAYRMLCRLVKKFDADLVPEGGDPEGQFRGWAHPFVRGECQREARRLRNGGTYHTRREEGRQPVLVEDLPRRRGDAGDEYLDLADHRGPAEEPDPQPAGVEYVTDPDEEL